MDLDNILEALDESFEYDSGSDYKPTSSDQSSDSSDSDIPSVNDTSQSSFSDTTTENSQQWNNVTSDKLGKIQPLVCKLVSIFKKIKVPGENIVIDETMIPFRGRLIFKQYIPNKTSKYGVKLFKICDNIGYTYDCIIYSGKNTTPTCSEITTATKVVLQLMNDYLYKGRTLIIDNYYTSLNLAHILLSKDTHMVGTLRKNAKGFPKDITNAKIKKGEIKGKEDDKGVVVSIWKDKRDVRMVSTKHGIEMISTGKTSRNGDVIKKPEAIIFYNKNKQGIDVSDQMTSYFTPLRKTIRWYHKVAFQLLLGTAVTANYRRVVKSQDFNLVSPSSRKHKLIETDEKSGQGNKKKRRRCVKCYEKLVSEKGRAVAQKNCKTTTLYCNSCEKNPAFCLECFQASHKIWGSENPRTIQEKEMHPERVTVWCGIWSGGLIGPYFFEDEEGNAVTVNGVRYRAMLSNFLWPRLDQMNIENVWFQQDGATCHTSRETIALLREKFPDTLISLRGDQSYPPRSCDLTPCDFFLWGYTKSRVYQNKVRNVLELNLKVIVWCAVSRFGVIGPYFFEERSQTVTVTSDRYVAMLRDFFQPRLAEFKKEIDEEGLDEEAYGEGYVDDSSVRGWFRRFKSGDFDVEDKERSGRPQIFEDQELATLLDEDSCQTQEELAEALGVDRTTISKRLKAMGMIQKQGNWVPYMN
ncbi:hypothetical protein QTP88_023037 [Uroleucon formosanum]